MRTGFFLITNCAVIISISILLQLLTIPQVFGANSSDSDSSNSIGQEFLRESVKDHLARFGYLVPGKTSWSSPEEDSILRFQAINSLEETGILDNSTLELMLTPRCGMSDSENYSKLVFSNRRNKRTTNNEIMPKVNPPRRMYKWNKKYITYRVSEYTKQPISPSDIDKDISKAFKLWEEHVNLKFVRSSRIDSEVDIDIRFVMGEHGDQTPFTGNMAETLGHAYPPGEELGGDIHFNDNFTWSEGTTFLHTATHEIGHALGLNHVMIRSAIMSPYQGDSSCPVFLDPDDIRQLQALYGPRPVPSVLRILKPDDDLLSPRLQTTLAEVRTTPAPSTRIWPWKSKTAAIESASTTAKPEKLTTISTFPQITSFSKIPIINFRNATTSKEDASASTTTVTPSEDSKTKSTIEIGNSIREVVPISPEIAPMSEVSISSIDNSENTTLFHDQVSVPHSTPRTATALPHLIETVIEPTVSTKFSETAITQPTKSSPELWTKIMTVLVSKVTEPYVSSTTPIPATTTNSDLDSGISTEIPPVRVFAIPPTVFPTDQDVHFTHRASSPQKLPGFETAVQIPTIPVDEDRVYFCDSNELCSKKELEENLTEDILALGSGNFELAFENSDSDSDDESDAVTLNPNPTRGNRDNDNSDDNETWRTSLKNMKTESESTPITHPDIFLLEETSEMSIPVQNLTSKISGDQTQDHTKGELMNASATLPHHWLSLIDVIIRSILILFIVLLRPSEYLTLCSYI